MPKASVTKVAQLSIPIRQLSVGVHGPFTTGFLPSDLIGYEVDFQNDASWPVSGPVLTVLVEQSNDGGPFVGDATMAFSGGPWFTDRAKTIPTNTSSWPVPLDNQGSATRQVQITVNVLQTCNLGATISSLT